MNKIKLSIIIPTYNGGLWIKDTIESVASQLQQYIESVEFIVRDNASLDNTGEIVSELNLKYDGVINYERRKETAIADVNFKESILLASGEYIQLLGDDDLLFPSFIRNTIELIDSNPGIGLIYYNRIATSREYEGASLKHDNPNSSFVHYYDDAKDFIREYPSGPDFMSVNIVKRECLLNGLPFAKEKYYGVEWLSAILYGLQGHKCLSVFYPLILQRAPSVRMWDDRALLYVIIGLDNMFEDLEVVYPGIYDIWNNYSIKNCSRFWYLTKCIPLNRSLYKSKTKELFPKLSTTNQMVAYLLIHFSISYYFFRFIYLCGKVAELVYIRKKKK